MSTNTEILEKIARLLSLAEGNDNENEAAAAMAAASRLMEKHKIDRATVDAVDLAPEEPIDVSTHEISTCPRTRSSIRRWATRRRDGAGC